MAAQLSIAFIQMGTWPAIIIGTDSLTMVIASDALAVAGFQCCYFAQQQQQPPATARHPQSQPVAVHQCDLY